MKAGAYVLRDGMDNDFENLFRDGARTRSTPSTRTCWASVKSINGGGRTVTAIVSSEGLDRDNEVILKTAFKESLPGFLKNPVVLAAHQHRLSNGRSPVVGVVKAARIVKGGLLAEIEFHTYTDIAEEYWRLYSNKVQRAFSVGFIPLEHEYRNIEGKTILCHTRIELLEISCVAIPSNRESLSRSAERKRGFIAAKKERERQDRDTQVFGEMTAGVGKYADREKYPWLHNFTAAEEQEAAEFEEKIAGMSEWELDAWLESDELELPGAHDRGGEVLVEAGHRSGDENKFADLLV